MKKIIITTITILLFITNNAKSIEKVVMGVDEWAPYVSKNLEGYGSASKILTEAFKSQNIEVEYKWIPWKRAYNSTVSGEIDGTFPWQKTPEREKILYYSDTMDSYDNVFFHLKSTSFNWNSYDDIKAFKVGGTIGYNYSPELKKLIDGKLIKYQEANSDLTSIKKLLLGRIDIFPCTIQVCESYIKDNFTADEAAKFTYHEKRINVNPHFLIVSKKNPNGKAIIDAFNAGLKATKK